jgi:ADP-heptose:LPS heptosyltransferase
MQETLYRVLFQTFSLLTDRFPHFGARSLNATIFRLVGNQFVIKNGLRKNTERLKRMKNFGSILVIGDLNIGDAVNLQSSISALRDFFPYAEIDYVINRSAFDLIKGNREISHIWPVFTGKPLPNENDLNHMKDIIGKHRYDLILNFCPFLKQNYLLGERDRLINFFSLAPIFIRNENRIAGPNHIVYQTYRILHNLLSSFMAPAKKELFKGVNITISDRAIKQAQNFLTSKVLLRNNPLILYNPDASSRFSRIPFQLQGSIIKQLAQLSVFILLGAGHTAKDIEIRLLNLLPPSKRSKVVLIPPSMPLDSYAALIDFSDVFVTGDTGPLHIAAARKLARSKNYRFRNKTAVFSIFGASSGRVYGYDSNRPGFFPANQEAPSYVYVAKSPCRNITCINKTAKTCKNVRCFQSLDTEKIVLDISSYLSSIEKTPLSLLEKRLATRYS